MGTYTTLLLDVDGTLLDFKASERAALETTFQRHGYLLNDSVKETYHAINSALWGRFERGEISREEVIYSRFVELFRALGIDGDGRAFEDEYQEELGRGRFCFRGRGGLRILRTVLRPVYCHQRRFPHPVQPPPRFRFGPLYERDFCLGGRWVSKADEGIF